MSVMIKLSRSGARGPSAQIVPTVRGRVWGKDTTWSVDAPPDGEIDARPEAGWSAYAVGTGVCSAVSPRIVALSDGSCRMYYTHILPHPEFPVGAVDYDNVTLLILRAVSADGLCWTPEPGVRLSARQGGADKCRVVSSEVVPIPNSCGPLRMYEECCEITQVVANSSRSAVSTDDGFVWRKESRPAIAPNETGLDAAKSSEVCVICLSPAAGSAPRYRIFHEGCCGIAPKVEVPGGSGSHMGEGVGN